MHLVLVDNPPQHPDGDFALLGAQLRLDADAGHDLPRADTVRLTFSGIGLYHRKVFANIAPRTRAPLAPLLRATIADGAASGEHHRGCWVDVGTPERLQRLDAVLRNSNAV
jgi:MurNAc alpha-1-phosphate uridylyltransferase